MKSKIGILIAFLAVMAFTVTGVAARTLTVSDGVGKETENVVITVTADTYNDIAGAAFTILFNDEVFNLISVDSGFFDTFSNQWAAVSPQPNPTPDGSVNVGGTDYDQPVLYQEDSSLGASGGVMIAGAQCEIGKDADGVLFSLTFEIKDGATTGEYTVGIQKTTLNNAAAGYDSPTDIPYLVTSDSDADLANAYPELTVDSVVDGSITVEVSFYDGDGDGMDDNWEINQFGDTNAAYADENHDQDTDHDQDGFSDLQEYLYSKDPHDEGYDPNDLNGDTYDPWKPNAEGGVGYTQNNDYWQKIDSGIPEAMIRNNHKVVVDFGAEAVHSYGVKWEQLSQADADLLISIDLDNDGVDTMAGSFPGYGLYVNDQSNNSWWTKVKDDLPEAMVRYGDAFAADFGATGGVQSYDVANGWNTLTSSDPNDMVVADIDGDGDADLVISTSTGVLVHDGGANWTTIHGDAADALAAYGNGFVADFGSTGGLKVYNSGTGSLDDLRTDDPSLMVAADVNGDGTDELVVSFDNSVEVFDDGSWTPILDFAVENMIAYGDSLAADFGVTNSDELLRGLFRYTKTGGWVRLTALDPGLMVTVDIDEDDKDELVVSFPSLPSLYIFDDHRIFYNPQTLAVDFGSTYGLYTYDYNQYTQAGAWAQLSPINPDGAVSVDIDNDDSFEWIIYFPGYGGYTYDSGWTRITTAIPENMIRYQDEVAAVDFGSTYGLYTYSKTQSPNWIQLKADDPDGMVAVDMDDDDKNELVVNFPGLGVLFYDETNGWSSKLTPLNPEDFIRYGDRAIAIDFGSAYGLYVYDQTSKWRQLSPVNPSGMVAVDMDKDGQDDLAIYFPGYGLYIYYTAGTWWSRITTIAPEGFMRFGENAIAIDFGSAYGLYVYDQDNKWRQLSPANPNEIKEAEIYGDSVMDLVVSFQGYGTYIYNGINSYWSRITTLIPENITAK